MKTTTTLHRYTVGMLVFDETSPTCDSIKIIGEFDDLDEAKALYDETDVNNWDDIMEVFIDENTENGTVPYWMKNAAGDQI